MSSNPPKEQDGFPLWNSGDEHNWTQLIPQQNMSAGSSLASLKDSTVPNLGTGNYQSGPSPQGQMEVGVWDPNQAVANTERTAQYSPVFLNMAPIWGEPHPLTGIYRAPLQTVPKWPTAVQSFGRNFGEQHQVRSMSPYSDYGTMSSAHPSRFQSPDPEEYIRNVVIVNQRLPADYVCDCCRGGTPDGGKHHIRLCPRKCSRCMKNAHFQRNLDPAVLAVSPYQGDRVSRGEFRCPCGHAFQSNRCYKNCQMQCKLCSRWLPPVKMFKHEKGFNAPQFHGFN